MTIRAALARSGLLLLAVFEFVVVGSTPSSFEVGYLHGTALGVLLLALASIAFGMWLESKLTWVARKLRG